MFSKTHEYAMRAVVALAERPREPLTTRQISVLTGVPCTYLAKVLQLLARADIIHGARGIGGGYVLQLPPANLSLLDVANAIEPLRRIAHCPLANSNHATELCALHRCLDSVLATAEAALGSMTVADLLNSGYSSRPLCTPPPGHQFPTDEDTPPVEIADLI